MVGTTGLTRRGLLGTAGGLFFPGVTAGERTANQNGKGRQDFLYLDPPVFTQEDVYRNLLAYAGRHDLAVILAAKDSTRDIAQQIEIPLRKAKGAGVEAWLTTGSLRDQFTAEELATSDVMRGLYLMEFRKIIEQYHRFFPDGKIICWHEEPQHSFWAVEGDTEAVVPPEGVRNFVEYGPVVFALQKRAIRKIAPHVSVGIFPHSSTLIGGGAEAVTGDEFRQLIEGMREQGVMPDFTYCDYYRGYVEPHDGVEAANADVRGLIEGVKDHTNGRPVYFLGEDHTIGTGYTPSKAAIRETLRTARSADPAGLGWYIYTSYAETTHGFDAFLPNVRPGPHLSNSNTFTRSRARFQYAYRSLFETRPGFDPANRFDVWVDGRRFPLHHCALELLRSDTGEWEYVGDFGGYIRNAGPRENPYDGYDTSHVSIFHALSRDRYVQWDGTVSMRVRQRLASVFSTESILDGIYLMPYDTADYVTENAAQSLLDEHDLSPYALGAETGFVVLSESTRHRVDIDVTAPDRRLGDLLFADTLDRREALATAEARDGFDPTERFDLWIGGADLDVPLSAFQLVGADGERYSLTRLSAAAATASEAGAFYGLDRTYLRNDLQVEVAADGPDPGDVHAMPYFGRDNFKAPEEIAGLLNDPNLNSFRLADGTATTVDPSRAAPASTTETPTKAPPVDGFGVIAAAGATAGAALARRLLKD